MTEKNKQIATNIWFKMQPLYYETFSIFIYPEGFADSIIEIIANDIEKYSTNEEVLPVQDVIYVD